MANETLPIEYLDTGEVARNKINNSFTALSATVQSYQPHIESGIWWIGNTNTGVKAVGDKITMKVEDGYIWYKSESSVRQEIIAVSALKGEKGDKGDPGTNGTPGKDGEDGYTPVKGVDYFTADDIASLNIPAKTSDLQNDSGFVASSDLGTAATKNTGTSSGNVPVLDSNGKLATSTLPGVALTDTFTVSTSSDLTSLSSAEQGDIAIATSENKTYVLSADPYSTAANWKEILTPTGGVTSVNGQTGAVTVETPNTKTFYLSSTSDLTTAQAAYDWYVAGKNPVLVLDSQTYILRSVGSTVLSFYSTGNSFSDNDSTGKTTLAVNAVRINFSSDTVTSITSTTSTWSGAYLRTGKDYSTPYTPEYDGSPATKKYVDDNVIQKGSTAPANPTEGMVWYDTTNDELKVYDGSNWIATGGGSDIEYVTQAEYNALLPGAASDGKHYFIYTPSVVPPWTPGANTVCYYPLDIDLNDASGNGYNLAGSNGAIIGTLNGVDCLDLSASNSYASVTISTIPQGNNVRTNMLWVYGNASGQNPAYQYGGRGNDKADVIYNINPIGWSQYGGSCVSSVSAQGTRCHVAVVIKSNGQQEMFVNGNMVSLGSLTVNTTGTTLYLGHCTWDNTYLNGYISKFIVENKARTAQEILDYYNQTKGDYGIS